DAAVRRFVKRVGLGEVDHLIALARADALAKGRPVEAELASLDELRTRIDGVVAEGAALGTKDLAITAHEVMQKLGVRPGRIIGRVLDKLLERVLDEPSLNQRDTLLGLVETCAKEESSAKGAS